MKYESNPYYLPIRPALISFSGGRSSGYMLKHIIDANGGELPDDIKVAFANTGKERAETLDFVLKCQQEWGCHIQWLEADYTVSPHYRLVEYDTASRNGEPFEAMIDKEKYLPGPRQRKCTERLKTIPIKYYAKHVLEWPQWSTVIGYRGDETHRVAKFEDCNKSSYARNRGGLLAQFPMWQQSVTKRDTLVWWARQPFDLNIGSYEGNCDLCFMKGKKLLLAILQEDPGLADWWIEQQNKGGEKRTGGKWQWNKGYDYEELKRQAENQMNIEFEPYDLELPCECTD